MDNIFLTIIKHSELEWDFCVGWFWGVKKNTDTYNFFIPLDFLGIKDLKKIKKTKIFFKGLNKGHRSIL